MSALVVLPVALPLAAAGVSHALTRLPRAQRVLGIVTLAVTVVGAVVLVVTVDGNGVAVAQLGGWVGPLGITLVADRLGAMMVAVSAAMVLAVLVYAIGHPRTADQARSFHPVYLVLASGVSFSYGGAPILEDAGLLPLGKLVDFQTVKTVEPILRDDGHRRGPTHVRRAGGRQSRAGQPGPPPCHRRECGV